jgi:hypothetical protein
MVGSTYSVSFNACNNDGSGGCLVISSHSFTVNVVNDAPVYVSAPPPNHSVFIQRSTYRVPNYRDTEGHTATTVGSSSVSFIQWNSTANEFIISPTHISQIGIYPVSLNLSDGGAYTIYNFNIKVNNRAP